MVKIAFAGGTGQVAREVIDALEASGKHEIVILSRSPVSREKAAGRPIHTVNYHDQATLTQVLTGVHTLLCFIPVHTDPVGLAQKTLIDAAIAAGVKRFAPSEWAGDNLTGMAHHAAKAPIRSYLRQINTPNLVLEYTLFQPGIFLDYLAAPQQTATHVSPLQTPFNFAERRTIIVEGHDPLYTFTSVGDMAKMVARAVEFDGRWPEVGGICGGKLRASEVVALGERVRGAKFGIERVKVQDLEAGKLEVNAPLPTMGHHTFSEVEMAAIIKAAYVGILLNGVHGGWDVGREWNDIFSDFEFEDVEEFMRKIWDGKP